MNSFLPDNYEIPQKAGNYMKFQDGENRFRALSSPIIGYLWWEENADGSRKPTRVPMDQKIPVSEVDPSDIKHFWAMVVYNYNEQQVQILEITQKGIQKAIKALARDSDWGSPLNYDLVVTKTGQKLETEYSVQPKPAKKLDEGIARLYKDMDINLNALYTGDDPFSNRVNEDVVNVEEIDL